MIDALLKTIKILEKSTTAVNPAPLPGRGGGAARSLGDALYFWCGFYFGFLPLPGGRGEARWEEPKNSVPQPFCLWAAW